MSLYLKYRPQNFATIVGQEAVVITLKNAIKKQALNHAYLFCGPRGTGKTSTARIVAKSLNCLNTNEAEPCDACENCQAILNHHLVDLIEIDAASNRGIDEIRELREKIQFAPSQGVAKIYIIDEVHMLTKEAFNALLKTLEEPPEHAYFILATTEAHKIPETIVSRCQQFSFKRITEENITERLTKICESESIQYEKDALMLIAKISRGGLRDAIGLLEQMNIEGKITYHSITENLGITGHMEMEAFLNGLEENKVAECFDILNQLNEKGYNLTQFCNEFIGFLRQRMIKNVREGKRTNKIIQTIEVFNEARPQIDSAIIPQLPLEIALIKCCETPSLKMHSKQEIRSPELKKPEITIKTAEEVKAAAEKAPKTEEKPHSTEENMMGKENIEAEDIRKKWKEVLAAIHTPFVKMSFQSSEMMKYEENKLFLKFRSSTLMEKIKEPQNQAEVVDAFFKVLKIKPKLNLELHTIEIKREVETPSYSMAEMAEEVFGN